MTVTFFHIRHTATNSGISAHIKSCRDAYTYTKSHGVYSGVESSKRWHKSTYRIMATDR